jgi:hypothetical protein
VRAEIQAGGPGQAGQAGQAGEAGKAGQGEHGDAEEPGVDCRASFSGERGRK